MSGFINGINGLNSLFNYSNNVTQSITQGNTSLLNFDELGVNINNTNDLMNFASMYSTNVTAEARGFLANQGLIVGELDAVESLRALTRDSLAQTRDVLTQVTANNPELPPYSPSNYTLSDSFNQVIFDAMDYKRYVEQRLAEDPNWEGDPTAATEREERIIQLTEQQTQAMNELNANIGVLATNTNNLPQMLNNLVQTSEDNNTVMGNLLGTVNSIQQWLVNFEEQMTLQAEAEEEAAALAAAQEAAEAQAVEEAAALAAAEAAAGG